MAGWVDRGEHDTCPGAAQKRVAAHRDQAGGSARDGLQTNALEYG